MQSVLYLIWYLLLDQSIFIYLFIYLFIYSFIYLFVSGTTLLNTGMVPVGNVRPTVSIPGDTGTGIYQTVYLILLFYIAFNLNKN